MQKKSLLIIAITTMLGLTACGGGDTIVDQELPRDDPSSEVSFEFWHCLGHEKTKNLTKVAEAFNAKYAGKYKVVLKHPAGDYSALHSTLKTKCLPVKCLPYQWVIQIHSPNTFPNVLVTHSYSDLPTISMTQTLVTALKN